MVSSRGPLLSRSAAYSLHRWKSCIPQSHLLPAKDEEAYVRANEYADDDVAVVVHGEPMHLLDATQYKTIAELTA